MARMDRTGGTPATVALTRAGVAFELHPYEPGAASGHHSYGLEAVTALGLDPAQVFKTLVARVDDRLVVAVVPVSGSLDLKALAAAVGGKRAEMAEAADAERATGFVVGGISPVGHRRRLDVVVDATASGLERVHVSAGRRGLQMSLAPADLVAVTGARVAPVARPG
ncbi:MAG TPA: Cys-tRNA(Pro) deacylase [Actinomycetes bacterium]|nr:Cys-tRNA(Pro) deacylase [Actinomycetes bacterium]